MPAAAGTGPCSSRCSAFSPRFCSRSDSRCSWSWASRACWRGRCSFRASRRSRSRRSSSAGVNTSTLLAIPFFVFAADIMARGSIARRLTDLVKANVGHLAGGIGHTAVISCMAFGSICGSAPATVAALGRLLHPELVKARYSEKFSLGLIASSAECALLIPPSITLIIYGWLTGTSIADLFAAGFVVGVVLGLAFMIQVQIVTWRTGAGSSPRASRRERLLALRDGLVALGLPAIILGGIYSGLFTATEAAAVAVIYALAVEVLIYRSFGWARLMEVAEIVGHNRGGDLHPSGDGLAAVVLHHAGSGAVLFHATVRRLERQLDRVPADRECHSASLPACSSIRTRSCWCWSRRSIRSPSRSESTRCISVSWSASTSASA